MFSLFYSELVADLSTPDIEGIYETNVKPELRALIKLGCMCAVEREEARKLASAGLHGLNTFSLEQLQMKNLPYLKEVFSGELKISSLIFFDAVIFMIFLFLFF